MSSIETTITISNQKQCKFPKWFLAKIVIESLVNSYWLFCLVVFVKGFNDTLILFRSLSSPDYINEVLHENPEDETKQMQADDWEGGLTFIAKSSRKFNLFRLFKEKCL